MKGEINMHKDNNLILEKGDFQKGYFRITRKEGTLRLIHVSHDLDRGWPTVTDVAEAEVGSNGDCTPEEAIQILCKALEESLLK